MSNQPFEETTQIGLHSVRNMLGDKNQSNLFSDQDEEFSKQFGVKLKGRVERFGFDLSDTQSRVLEGILHGFSITSYKGNLESLSKEDVSEEYSKGLLPPTYKYIDALPRLRATQADILEWSGIKKGSIASRVRALESLQELGSKQYCFFYDRLAFDENRIPIQDRSGKWKKEEVVAVDTLFTIKEIRDEDTGKLQYYEITPSPLFLDQRESYFMLVPNNWREEVRTLYGNKKASSYTFRLLMFLRYQYEMKRRSKSVKAPYEVRWSSEEVATSIKMSATVVKRNRKRMNELLESAYETAVKLGYLTKYERLGHLDILCLNDNKYYGPGKLSAKSSTPKEIEEIKPASKYAEDLFVLFHENRKKLDPKHTPSSGSVKSDEVNTFDMLLKGRSLTEITTLIKWSVNKKFWCTQLSTPSKIVKKFSEAWSEMSLDGTTALPEDNKAWASDLLNRSVASHPQTKINILNKYLEIGIGAHQPTCVPYEEKNFKEKVLSVLKRFDISLPSS